MNRGLTAALIGLGISSLIHSWVRELAQANYWCDRRPINDGLMPIQWVKGRDRRQQRDRPECELHVCAES